MKILWLFLAFLYAKNVDSSLPAYRLPGNVRPTHYTLEVLTELDEPNLNFAGKVWIKVKCFSVTNSIVLHSKNLTIKDKEVTVKEIVNNKQTSIPVTSVKPDKYDFLIINLGQNLKQGSVYEIYVSFSAPLSGDLIGYYKSSYVEKKTKKTKWLAVTQFGPTYARRAFPCLDEPEMKAKFTVRLAHKKHLKAISNMPLRKTSPYNGKNGYVLSEFQESVVMSTYLVAYMVSDFEFQTAPARPNKVTFKVWSRKEVLSQTGFAKELGPRLLEYFENYFTIKYPLPKIDMAAIPQFKTGAMENWGLVTYREMFFLYDPKTSSKLNHQEIAEVIAHELAHQWFGNLVTMKWWTDLWLNEGFATYIGVWAIDKLYPKWEYMSYSVLAHLSYFYNDDSLESTHPVSKKIEDPELIPLMAIDLISYFKGSMIVRMMHLFLGNSFRKGLIKYLKKQNYACSSQDDLWAALTEQAHADGILDKSLTVKEVMDTWTLQAGHPLVTVTRDYAKRTAKLSQKIYFRVKPKGQVKETFWWIPITYTTQDKRDFKNPVPKLWLSSKNNNKAELTNLNPKSWLILNVNIAGLYRVNYDDQNWKLITDTLNSDKYREISAMNRADLLINVFDLAWSGDVKYSQTFKLARYLAREKEWAPWSAAFNKLRSVHVMLRNTNAYSYFKDFMVKIITPLYKRHSKLTAIPKQPDQIRLHSEVSILAADYDLSGSVKQITDLFAKWMKTPDPDRNNPIPVDLGRNYICRAITFGGVDSWEFLLKRYQNCADPTEKDIYLQALACSRDVSILNRALEMSIQENSPIRKEDSTTLFVIMSYSGSGYSVACDFLQRRIKDISKYHSGSVGSYVESCGSGIMSEDELKKFNAFVSANQEFLKGEKSSVDNAVSKAQANIDWHRKNRNDIINALKSLK